MGTDREPSIDMLSDLPDYWKSEQLAYLVDIQMNTEFGRSDSNCSPKAQQFQLKFFGKINNSRF